MGSSIDIPYGLRSTLDDLKFRVPNEIDFNFLSSQTKLPINIIKNLFNSYLEVILNI
jgi:hypothetical protein